MVSEFKTGVAYIRNDGNILNIIGNSERATFMLVNWLDGRKPFTVAKDYYNMSEFKELGPIAVAHILYSKSVRGA